MTYSAMAPLDTNYRRDWQVEQESQARYWHAYFAWAVMLAYPLWGLVDYNLVQPYWEHFLTLRLAVVALVAFAYLATRFFKFSSKYLAYTICLSVFASMSAMQPYTGMAYYFYGIGMAAAILGSALFLNWHLRHSVVVYTLGLLFYFAFDREIGAHDFSFSLINGGVLLITVTVFALLFGLVRNNLARREFTTRRTLDRTRLDLEDRTNELNQVLENLEFSDQELQNELEIASEIQRGILPDLPLNYGEIHVVGYYRPLGKVGGDYFEVIPMRDGCLGILIVDASGHGVPAALLTMIAKIAFIEAVDRDLGPADALRYINEVAGQSIRTIEYLTAQCLMIDSKTGRVVLANGAHRPAMYLDYDSHNVRELDLHGLILGQFPDQEFVTRELTIEMKPGDRICLITDGFEESRNPEGQDFGIERLKESFSRRYDTSAERHMYSMLSDWRRFIGDREPEDDCAMLMIERAIPAEANPKQF